MKGPEYWKVILSKVLADKRYEEGVTYGKPRTGHQEGNVANHLRDLEAKLSRLCNALAYAKVPATSQLSEAEYLKLRILIHVHDTFKFWAKRDSPIADPESHASLARTFLAELVDPDDPECKDLLAMVQHHDEGYALWKQKEARGRYNPDRFERDMASISDIDLFLLFTLLDGYTPSKEHEKIRWFADEVSKQRPLHPRVRAALDAFGI